MFLHDDLHKEVYMRFPEGFIPITPGQTCIMQKSIYRLWQASRQWFSKLSTALLCCGYVQSKSDHFLLAKGHPSTSFIALLIYVDDVVPFGKNIQEINIVKDMLDSAFKIKDLGDLKFFLGFSICQRKYALELLEDTKFLS